MTGLKNQPSAPTREAVTFRCGFSLISGFHLSTLLATSNPRSLSRSCSSTFKFVIDSYVDLIRRLALDLETSFHIQFSRYYS